MDIRQKQVGVVFKTDKEVSLNDVYVRWIKSDGIIPKDVVKRFKSDVEEIRKENPLYN